MNLTKEQKEQGRVAFRKAVAGLPPLGDFGPSDPNFEKLQCGVIGTGGEGRLLMENIDPNYIDILAVSDIRPDHAQLAAEVCAKRFNNPNAQIYAEYKDLLARDDIEAVIIASPLWQHAPMSIAALEAGKHVFCEKTMAKTIDECIAMNDAAKTSGKNLQIGHQRFYSPIYHEMYRLVMGGVLGDVLHIRCQWHRNGNWVRPRWWENPAYLETYPTMKDFDPSKWGYGEPDNLCNWRLYEKHSEGLFTELASHMIAITNWLGVENVDPQKALNLTAKDMYVNAAAPVAVMASGGTYKFKDGEEGVFEEKITPYKREIEDHIYATFVYPNNLTVMFSSIQTNAFGNYYEFIQGTKGSMVLSSETDCMLFWEPGWEKQEANKIYVEQEDPGENKYHWSMAYRDELRGFAETIRYGRNNLCDGTAALYAAQAVLGARIALKKQQRIEFNEDGRPKLA